jgi:hypothetical protein
MKDLPVREIDPEFPVVYMTSASVDEWGSQGVPNSIKPFRMHNSPPVASRMRPQFRTQGAFA